MESINRGEMPNLFMASANEDENGTFLRKKNLKCLKFPSKKVYLSDNLILIELWIYKKK